MSSGPRRARLGLARVLAAACALAVSGIAAAQPPALPAPRFSSSDVEFFQATIPHQAQAIDMADLADTRSRDERVRAFARQLSRSGAATIRTIQDWLTERGQFAPERFAHHGEIPDLPGIASPDAMRRLAASTGPAFDRLFVELLTAHHDGALTMIADLAKQPWAMREHAAAAIVSALERDDRNELEQLHRLSATMTR